MARFYIKAQFGAVTIFEGGVYSDQHARTASIVSLSECTYNVCAHMYYSWQSITMQQDFEGGVYWDEFPEKCGDISRAVGFRGAARF